MAAGKSKGTNTEKNWQTNTNSGSTGMDPQTEAWIKQIYESAQGAGGQVPDSVKGALGFLSGDAAAGKQFMNPYQSQVIDAMNKQFGVDNANTTNAINDQATRAGAFGGSRHGVAQGVALGENARNQSAQIAGLLNQGYDASTGRALAAANLGMTAGSPDLWKMNILKQGFMGLPYGQTYRGTSGQTGTRIGTRGTASVEF